MSEERVVDYRGVGQVRHERRLQQEERARRWLELNPGEPVRLCAKATGVPLNVARRVASGMGREKLQGRVLPAGLP